MEEQDKDSREETLLLLEGSLRAIPFNILLAVLLGIILYFNQVPQKIIVLWLIAVCFISAFRIYFCKKYLHQLPEQNRPVLLKFIILTLFMGIAWGACYLISLPYINELHEFIIILVFGGMSAGSIASLSASIPAYLAYILPMFIPVVLYNYTLLNFDRAILATMFFLFVIMVIISAILNHNLLIKLFHLSNERERLITELRVLSYTDSLTGLYNRRHFEEILQKELLRAKRNRFFLSLALVDVDNFKLINDNLGHPFGDRFLIHVAQTLKHSLQRINDSVFRLGGDEFAVILANSSLKETTKICEHIRHKFEEDNVLFFHSAEELHLAQLVSLSMGIVHIRYDNSLSIEKIISAADQALYQSKKAGRNRLIINKLY